MKKLRYKRIIFVVGICILMMTIVLYMYRHRNHFYEYNGDIKIYTCTYRQDNKVYSFDLKAFQIKNNYYVSLNDLYNMIVILDKDAHVYLQTNKHIMVYELKQITYYFNYGQDKIVYNNDCIKLKDYNYHIYISHKNVYINVFFVEKLLFNHEKSIKFHNETATIQ